MRGCSKPNIVIECAPPISADETTLTTFEVTKETSEADIITVDPKMRLGCSYEANLAVLSYASCGM